MEVKNTMYIVKCPNIRCKNPIRLSQGSYLGGVNDSGGIIIECDKCGTVFPSSLKNPRDASGIISGGKNLDHWIDDLPFYLEDKYKITKKTLMSIERAVVFDYEKPPKVNWKPSSFPLFSKDRNNFELQAQFHLKKHLKNIQSNYEAYKNYYLKGRDNANKSFVILNYEFSGVTYIAVFAKLIDNENDLNTDNLYLINHTETNLEEHIDGIYTRDESLTFLERLLNRWRYTSNEVLLVVPFIGFHYKNSEEALMNLWNWLEVNIDIDKTNLITRKGTFNLFKKAQDGTGIPFDELVEWGLLEPLIEKMDSKNTAYFQKSHAKYYVGVYDDYVEVISGSFNIHGGQYFENVTFKKYDKKFFLTRYLHMFKDFEFSEVQKDELVHYMVIGGEEKNSTISLQGLKNLFD